MTNVNNAFAELGRQIAPVTLPPIANPFDISRESILVLSAHVVTPPNWLSPTSLRVRFIYLELPGFDTHGEEKNTLVDLLNILNNGLNPLIQTLKASGRWPDTAIATLTEFDAHPSEFHKRLRPRRASASMIVMGGRVKGRQVNPVPTVTQINRGDFFTDADINFRHVFREIIVAMGLPPDGNGNQRPIFPYRVAPRPQPLNLF